MGVETADVDCGCPKCGATDLVRHFYGESEWHTCPTCEFGFYKGPLAWQLREALSRIRELETQLETARRITEELATYFKCNDP